MQDVQSVVTTVVITAVVGVMVVVTDAVVVVVGVVEPDVAAHWFAIAMNEDRRSTDSILQCILVSFFLSSITKSRVLTG